MKIISVLNFQIINRAFDSILPKILKLLIFVRDFVNLPQTFENEFREIQYSLTSPNTPAMTISKGTKEFPTGLREHLFDYDPAVVLEEERRQKKRCLQKRVNQCAEEERHR